VDPATAIDAIFEKRSAERKIKCLLNVSDYSLHGNGDSERDDGWAKFWDLVRYSPDHTYMSMLL
jgi:hypothetical protein